jgi:hypothetical protein
LAHTPRPPPPPPPHRPKPKAGADIWAPPVSQTTRVQLHLYRWRLGPSSRTRHPPTDAMLLGTRPPQTPTLRGFWSRASTNALVPLSAVIYRGAPNPSEGNHRRHAECEHHLEQRGKRREREHHGDRRRCVPSTQSVCGRCRAMGHHRVEVMLATASMELEINCAITNSSSKL